jgi:starch-binding outer membrane protein, SusD/RagB family
MKNIYQKFRPVFFGIALCLSFSACEDFVQIDLTNTKISSQAVFSDDKTATAAAVGMYDVMQRISAFGASGAASSITALTGLSADELDNYSPVHQEIHQNNILVTNPNVLSLWSSLYNTIYVANSLIEGVSASETLSPSIKNQLLGEGKFVRAFCHLYLINLFGDIPLITNTDYRINSKATRSPGDLVYSQIISDLIEAKNLMGENYVSDERGRPNKFAAAALLARVYLYRHQFQLAEESASEVIEHSELYQLMPELNDVFLKTSHEAIWQLPSAASSRNTWEGRNFILNFAPFFVALNEDILQAFEPDDQRLTKWIKVYTNGSDQYYYPYKYKISGSSPKNEHSILLRLAELYLIRAEARTMQDKVSGSNSAETDLNVVRNRAGLQATTASTRDEMLSAILAERRLELFTEWGHRWFDLKRTGNADQVLTAIKPGWSREDLLYPIPDLEMSKAPNLKPQNPGY